MTPAQAHAGQVAVVTGGASGIGAAVVTRMRAAGATVIAADITPGDTGAHALDVSDPAAVASFAEEIRDAHGRCDVLVNCAGAVTVGTAVTCTEQDWDRTFAVNTRGVWLMCHHLIPLMPDGAAIVNVASGAGLRPIPNMAAYVASKTAVVGLSKAMAMDHADRNIRVNCVCPGLVDTPLASRTQQQRPAAASQAVASFEGYLIKRLATPDEIAGCICYLGSTQASYITGAAIAVDGGRTLH
ncbi:SDR family NAD(P)-dependent oxidoreductase [Leekyejoonella antrihumi]|uniref:SDR family oxidoreductase n=1 Tax=Leekyejoonella antrihumi TaxID=1660198 RepID=A0A563DSV6_9MICO|nr:SDR family oxidoreductase [Leekyejoonella antrihumi]TWP33249.1 SDR family oxidoreductase [Leekyejoonella antrihumi]